MVSSAEWPELGPKYEGCVIVPEDSCRVVMAGMEALLRTFERHPEYCAEWLDQLRWAVGDMRFFLGMGRAMKTARRDGNEH